MLADSPGTTWNIAEILSEGAGPHPESDRVELVKRFAATEIAEDFRLGDILDKRIAVHHAGLSPELRYLVEWLTEEGDVQILVATTTLAQGVNFPVSSVVLATHFLYQPKPGQTGDERRRRFATWRDVRVGSSRIRWALWHLQLRNQMMRPSRSLLPVKFRNLHRFSNKWSPMCWIGAGN